MVAKIIISQNLAKREKFIKNILEKEGIKIPDPDLLYFSDEDKLGMEEAKNIHRHFSTKPFSSSKRSLVILSGQNLTHASQNSLLKLLEEPAKDALILIGTSKEDSLLPTVLSRCEIIFLEEEKEILDLKEAERFVNSALKERFVQIETIEDKELFLQKLMVLLRQNLKSNLKLAPILKELLILEKWSQANVNQRAILEYIALLIEREQEK